MSGANGYPPACAPASSRSFTAASDDGNAAIQSAASPVGVFRRKAVHQQPAARRGVFVSDQFVEQMHERCRRPFADLRREWLDDIPMAEAQRVEQMVG